MLSISKMKMIAKRVDTVSILVNISVTEYESRVSGYAYPFGSHFHSVSFSAIREMKMIDSKLTMGEATPEIGFGGNQFKGENAVRILKAAQVAFDQANYYSELSNEFARGAYIEILRDAVNHGHPEQILDCLLLTPQSGDHSQSDLLHILKSLLCDARKLGSQGYVTADNLESLDKNYFYGLMRLCALSDKYLAKEKTQESRIEGVKNVINYIHNTYNTFGEKS